MGDPRRGRVRGLGRRIHVSAVGGSKTPPLDDVGSGDATGLARLSERAWVARAFGDFWQHCLVAEGALDLATDEQLQLWDYAAVQLVVEEAGGRCSAFDGSAPAPGKSFLAANAAIHAAAVALLA